VAEFLVVIKYYGLSVGFSLDDKYYRLLAEF